MASCISSAEDDANEIRCNSSQDDPIQQEEQDNFDIEEQQEQDHRGENMPGYEIILQHRKQTKSKTVRTHQMPSSDAVEEQDAVNRFDELNIGYTYKGTYVTMNDSRGCYYNKQEYKKILGLFMYTGKDGGPANKDVKIPIGKPIPRQKSPDITPMDVEMRGITFAQLLAVKANVEKRCVKEGWVSTKDNETLLTPEKVTLYDLNKYIIIPYTEKSESSFVETLPSTTGTQPPRFFVSHTWGERFYHTLDCIKQMIKDFKNNQCYVLDDSDQRGGGMTEHTPIWICAFANNQHDLDQAITADPSESGFAKAMEVANYRTISILDKDGIVFERIWCVYELYLTLIHVQEKRGNGVHLDWNGLWAVYTAHEHTYREGEKDEEKRKAVGIVPGRGTTTDKTPLDIANRERHFPPDVILLAVMVMIQKAKASKKDDENHILNYISGNIYSLDAEPPKQHIKYDALNDAVRTAYALTIPSLQHACRGEDDKWQGILTAMSKSTNKKEMVFNFGAGYGWDDVSAERVVEMISRLPPSIEGLWITNAPYGSSFMDALIEWIKNATHIKSLAIEITCVGGMLNGGRDVGARLADALATKNTLEALALNHTDLIGSRNVNEWSEALGRMELLKSFSCEGTRRWGIMEFVRFRVDKSTLDDNSMVEHPRDKRQRIYWNDGTFPDSTMSWWEVWKLNRATKARVIFLSSLQRRELKFYKQIILFLLMLFILVGVPIIWYISVTAAMNRALDAALDDVNKYSNSTWGVDNSTFPWGDF